MPSKEYHEEMRKEVERVMEVMDDNGYPFCDHIDYKFAHQFVKVETINEFGMYIHWIWAVPNEKEFKEVLKWFVTSTKFYGVTAYMEGHVIPTFRSAKEIDREYEYYFK